MARLKQLWRGVPLGIALSFFLHTGAGGTLYYAMLQPEEPVVEMEIDLSMVPPPVSMTPTVPARLQEEIAPPPPPPPPKQTWTVPKKDELPPPPVVEETPEPEEEPPPVQEVVEAPPVIEEAPVQPACPNCQQVASIKEYIPATQAARQPRWVGNLITRNDYPMIARKQKLDGRVVVSVWLDEIGKVQDVRLLKGSYEALNEVVLRKVRGGVFTPAYNHDGRPISVKVILPIRFEME